MPLPFAFHPGAAVKNIVLCFDRAQHHSGKRAATNAGALFGLAENSARQLTWYDAGLDGARRWRSAGADVTRSRVVEAYRFLVDVWSPGDAVYIFGVSRGAACARELARLLGTIGVWQDREVPLLDYLLDTYVLPRTPRNSADWRRVSRLAAAVTGRRNATVPVRYLGLWDAVTVPGAEAPPSDELPAVAAGRHAVAIDGAPTGRLLGASTVEEVWFRGGHCDVTGTAGACLQLADIALDWVLDGAVHAGMHLRGDCRLPSPTEFDALAGSSHTLSLRRVPEDAAVHASVEIYLRARPQYWRRLPARLRWADAEWLARGERLVAAKSAQAPVDARELMVAISS